MAKFIATFPEISLDWLITGAGEKFNTKNAENLTVLNGKENGKEKGKLPNMQNSLPNELAEIISEQLVPVFEFHAFASLTGLLSGKLKPSSFMYLPNLPKCDGATSMPGDSMEPEIQRGDLIVFRKVNDFNSGLFLGQIYYLTFVLEGHEYSMIRYILAGDDEQSVKLVSTNKRYAPSDIPVDSIKELAMIMASVRQYTMV